jgi:uncharacterized protein YfdQ (DUF2303 family)
MNDTTAEVVRDLAHQTAEPTKVQPGTRYVWITRTPEGSTGKIEVDLSSELPARKMGIVQVADVASFAAYYAKHADEGSEVFADLDAATITAVLDAHEEDGPRWQQHRLVLAMQPTEPWKTWKAHDRKFMPQVDFAEFLEDNYWDLDPNGAVKGADLLEAAQKFEATIKVEYGAGSRLRSGDVTVRRIETTEQGTGKKGYIDFPEEMDLAIKPYADCDDDTTITARLRYRINGDQLLLGYFLNEPERVRREAVEAVVAKAADTTAAPILLGSPSS